MTLEACDPRPADHPLLARLEPGVRRPLLARSVVHSAPAGVVLFDQGEAPTFQHLVLSGAVHLFGRAARGGEVLVETVEAPDLVLPAAVVTRSPWLAQARTLGPARLLLIEADAFREAVNSDLVLAREVIGSLAAQSRRMLRQIKTLKLRTAPQRAAWYILELARKQGSDSVVLPREKGLIASELGISRESFSRALAALQRQGVEGRAEILTITDRRKLEAFSNPDPLTAAEGVGGR
jgi:CRP/FNR family transcriptional activator FtrB